MASTDIQNLIRPVEVETQGSAFSIHQFDIRKCYKQRGAEEVPKALKHLLNVNSVQQIVCWYDELKGMGDPNYYLCFPGGYIIGAFFKEKFGQEVPSHFFIRVLTDFHGSLEHWKNDVRFPEGVTKYSACALLPEDFEMPYRGTLDPFNHAVTTYTWEYIRECGIDIHALLGYMQYGR